MSAALCAAIDLLQLPTGTRHLRAKPLPDGMTLLLQIISGSDDATLRAADRVGRSTKLVREAAEFYILQILFAPDADSYRVLGTNPDASARELRRNMALLLRWLHPDLDPKGERSMFAARVTRAWEDLKTPQRRTAYSQRLRRPAALPLKKKASPTEPQRGAKSAKSVGDRGTRGALHLSRVYVPRRIGLLQRLLIQLFGKAIL
jgi:DnaJ domain